MGDYDHAAESYERALSIRLELAKTNPLVYLPEASCTLSNLAFFYLKSVPDREKSVEYALETIRVLLPLYEEVPFTQGYFLTAIKALKGWDIADEDIETLIAARMQTDPTQEE